MTQKILLWTIVVLSFILIIEVSFQSKTNFSFEEEMPPNQPKITKIKVYDEKKNQIYEIPLEEYILGVVSAEMPASFELEALKAQAVAARTFAMYKKEHQQTSYDVLIGTEDQAYQDKEQLKQKWQEDFETNYQKINKAVLETSGEIMTYQGQVIEAFYFSMSNGYTEDCDMVFQETLPYLTSVESSWDNETLENYEVTKEISQAEFCEKLAINCDYIEITNVEKTSTGRVNKITINQQTFRGTEIRTALSLRSTDFDIILQNPIIITTRGYGHGVGMSQYGANGMAKEGKKYQEILSHYYQNIEFFKI